MGMTTRPRILTAVLAAAALASTLAACGGGTASDPNLEACDAFAYYLRESDDGVAGMDRQTTVEQVRSELTRESDISIDPMIETGLGDLERTVDANVETWTLAADTIVAACQEYGWTVD